MENKLTASELRIGNYLLIDGIAQKVEAFMPNENEVKFNKGDYFKISFEHHKHNLTYETASDENVEPIPLTEEWLLRFGFKQLNKQPVYTIQVGENIDNKILLGVEIGGWFGICYDNLIYQGINDNKIKYVHQLQNLYFALTNTELTIK